MTWFVLLVALLVPQASPKGSIEGVILNSTTGEPVGGAQVTLIALSRDPAAGGGSTMAVTGGDGRFSYKDLNPGTYRLNVAANGYSRQDYGQHGLTPGPGTPISLSAGQTLKGITIRLTPTGVVSGRVLDEFRQPAVDAPVQLIRVAYGPDGKRLQAAGSANVNDRGDYRLYGVTPGRYFLMAGAALGMRPPGLGNPNQAINYSFSFYPGVTEIGQASSIEVKSSMETIIDMTVARQQFFRVRGRVIDATSGRAPAQADISLGYRSFNGGGGSIGAGRVYDSVTGNFELRDVVPGDYTVRAQIQDSRPIVAESLANRQAAAATRPLAELQIKVVNADVDGLVLVLSTGFSISGRLIVDGTDVARLPGLDRIRVMLRPSMDGMPNPGPITPISTGVTSGGAFRIDNVRESEYIATINAIPAGYYVQRATLDGLDILGGPVKFSGGNSRSLDIVLRPGAAQINGTVSDTRGQPVAGVQAIVVPAQRNRTDLYKTAITDSSGHFAINGITPGDYKVFSWESLEPFAYLDPEVIKPYEALGRPVHISENAAENVELKVISD